MINNVVLIGRLVATPKLKCTPQQNAVTSFTLAVERSYARQGEQRQADFINCVAWRKTAEFITKYFQKGNMIAVTGSIQTRNYQDQNGNKRIAVEVIVEQASFCGEKVSANNAEPNYTQASSDDFEEISGDEDLPF